jgi:HlyD family secretion protein/epimerase transport system membrane fusion protein
MTADIALDRNPCTSLRSPLLAGTAVALAFFAGLGGWAATAPLAGAAVAPAVVAPDGSRKTVQHLEGGIVRGILVQDGSRVAAGQPLVEFDDTHARAEHAALLAGWHALKAAEARLLAEQAGRERPSFPAELVAAAPKDPALARLLTSEAERLAARRAALDDQKAVLAERIAQAEAEIDGHAAEIASGRRQLGLIEEEARVVAGLLAKGLERRPRLLTLERTRAQIEGTIAAGQAAVARARQVIAEARQQMRSLESEQAEKVAAELAEVRRDLASRAEKLRATADRLARTVVAAPVAGTVVGLKVKTPGGVVNPGEPLLDLVPANADLLLEARVAPVDIDEVHAGLKAQVHLLAYRSRNLPRIEGMVREVSADRLEDPHTREPYYLARVAVARAALPAGIALAPGMPADVMIVTGERTLLDYLTRPIADALRRGLRES